MTLIERLLYRHENLKLRLYRCTAGKLSIGVGRNLEDNGISKEEALFLLKNDLSRVERELATFSWFAVLDPVRQDVLRDMNFNLGWAKFTKFKVTLAAVARGDYLTASQHMLKSLWAKQVGDLPGQRAYRLAEMMRTGLPPTDL